MSDSIWHYEKDNVVNRVTEIKAFQHGANSEQRNQFQGIEEFVYRQELEMLLGANWINNLSTKDALLTALKNRLESRNIYASKEQLKRYLRNVSALFKARMALGEEISAIPFTGASYQKRGAPVKRKKGKKRKVLHNNQLFNSIREAADSDPMISYDALRKAISRQDMANRL